MIFDGDRWVVVDPGSIDFGQPKEQVYELYHRLLASRWGLGERNAEALRKENVEQAKDDGQRPDKKKEKGHETEKDPSRFVLPAQLDFYTKKMKHARWFKTPGGMELKPEGYIDSGLRGRVWKVKGKDGKAYALKVAINKMPETLDSFRREPERTASVANLGLVSIARIVESGPNYLVKEWVEGTRGDKWFEQWVKDGADGKDPVFKKLLALYDTLAAQGVYIGDLNRKNLSWNGQDWIIIESGQAHLNQPKKGLVKKYRQKFYVNWTKYISCPNLVKILGIDK